MDENTPEDEDDYTPEDLGLDEREPLDYRREFARVLRGDWITGFLAVNALGALIWAIFAAAGARIVLITVGIVAAVAAVGFNHVNWRCPSCNQRIPRDVGERCPHCAARLR